jgi:hypothetical protein
MSSVIFVAASITILKEITDNNQCGFRPNSPTEKASFKLIEEI